MENPYRPPASKPKRGSRATGKLPGPVLFAFALIVLYAIGTVSRAYSESSLPSIVGPASLVAALIYLAFIIGIIRRSRIAHGCTVIMFLAAGFAGTIATEDAWNLMTVIPAVLLLLPTSLAYTRKPG